MIKFVRVVLWGLAICCLTWLGILWWWQRSGRAVAQVDMVVYLGVLPLVVMVLILALRRAWTKAGAVAGALHATDEAGSTSVPAGVQASSADERLRHATLRLVHAAIVSTGGTQPSDLLQAAADGDPLPVPDKSLVGASGLPAMCARLPDAVLALEGCRDRLDALVEQVRLEHDAWQVAVPGESVVRALAALEEPMSAQRQWMLDHVLRAGDHDPLIQPELPRVQLLLGCDAGWSAFEQRVFLRWAGALWVGDDDAVRDGCILQTTLVPMEDEEVWLAADRTAHSARQQESPSWLLVAAAHSDLDQSSIDALSGEGRLYQARSAPGGAMPGEAAATVLIAPTGWIAPADLAVQPVLLHRSAAGLRGKPVEAAGKVDALLLQRVVGDATTAARLHVGQIAALVCDADQHSPRATELYGLTIADLPQLDPLQDMRVLGKVTGHVGAASSLLVLACASEWARTLSKPVLALGMADSRTRMALIVQPELIEDAAANESATANRTSRT